ncbi:MAG: ATP-binding protein [Leptolyngbyaceae bacterium]|nr:ATP-binding protein [Leptolyngbyaceae bacterium]
MRVSFAWAWPNPSLQPMWDATVNWLNVPWEIGSSHGLLPDTDLSPLLLSPQLGTESVGGINSQADVKIQVMPLYGANQLVLDPGLGIGAVSESINVMLKGDRFTTSPASPDPSLPPSSPSPHSLPTISDQVFTQVFERSPDAMTISTLAEGRFVAVNQKFLDLSEYQRPDLIGIRSTELNFWPNAAAREGLRQKIERQGSLYNEEGEFRTQSGRLKIVTVSAEIITIDDCPCVLCSIRDITQEKQAEAQLQLANERDRLLGQIALNIRQSLDVEQILQSTVAEVRQFLRVERVFITRFDPGKRGSVAAESVAPSFPSLAGETIDSDVYDELVDLFSHTPVRVIDDMHSEMNSSHCFQILVSRYQVKAGMAVPIIVNGMLFGMLVAHQCEGPRPWTEFEQQLLQRLATQVAIAIQQSELYDQIRRLNITLEQQVADRTHELEQRTYELADRTAELEQRTQELEELGRFRDFLLHAVTHDLRTTAVGTTMLLKSLASQPGETIQMPRRLLNTMVQACNQQRDKLDAIREVHTLEIQGMPLNVAPLNGHTLVDNVMALLQLRAHQNDAVLINNVPLVLPSFGGDTVQLERVFQHLMTNAIAHNPPGVTVTVEAEVLPPNQAHGSTVDSMDENCGYIKFSVKDDGQGIPLEKRDRLFHLCSDCAEFRQFGGIRLGLYLCRQVITAHSGIIEVESEPQQGTTVWFVLPYTQENIAPEP